jgi:TPR repeat protein
VRAAPLALAACLALGCGATPKDADYVGNPTEMSDACARAATVCPAGDEWTACRDDQWDCHRLGLWYEDGIKVTRDPARAHEIFEAMCDRFEMGSCKRLCDDGDAARCVDLALLGIAGAGGRPFPPSYDARDRATFDGACRAGDAVGCAMLALDYAPGRQRVVQRVNNCFDDQARCFAAACDEGDPLGCALLCHVGEPLACARLSELARSGAGFELALPEVASGLAVEASGASALEDGSGANGAVAYEFEKHEQPAGAIPRAPKPPQPHVGEGLWSGWKSVHNVEGGALGVTPVVTRTEGAAHHTTDVSGLAGFFAEIYLRSWYPSDDKYLRFSGAGAIGGGTDGLDGQLAHDAMGGLRFPFASTRRPNPTAESPLVESMSDEERDALDRVLFTESPHALFVRGGYSMRYSSVGPVQSSAIELPRLELGYHFEGQRDLFRALELRAHAGLVLVGRFNVEDDVERLGGGVGWGGALVLHTRPVHAELGAERIQGAIFGARPPVHRLDARSCLRLGGDAYLLCLQELLERGSPGGAEAMAWQAGVFMGVDGLD